MSRAVVATAFGGPEVLSIVNVDDGPPGPGQIAVDVRAAGVNPADWKMYGGEFGTKMPLPMRVGMEASGIVTGTYTNVPSALPPSYTTPASGRLFFRVKY